MAVTNADILGWLNANPNATPELINKTMAEAGVSAAQYQSATGTPPPQVAQPTSLSREVSPPPPVTQGSSPQKVETLLQELVGNQAINTVLPTPVYERGGPVQVNPPVPTEDAKTTLTKQILAQGTTSQWSGEGKGSTEANATDIAGILSSIGITDINQFGQIPKVGSIGVTPQYQYIDTGQSDEYGPVYTTKLIGYTDANGNPVDASKVVDTGEGLIANNVVIGTTYGNKVTGQEVPNTYSERQVGNAFGGTYQGKGNTAYRVDMSSGTPVFYTTEASSKDTSLLPLVQMALMATGAGSLLGNAILGAGASQVAANALGGALLGAGTTSIAGGDAWKGALLGGAGGALGGALSDASSVPMLDAADTAGGLIPKYGTSYDDWMQLVLDNPEAQQALLNAITNQASQTGLTATTDAQNLTTSPSVENVNVTGVKTPITTSQVISAISQLPVVNVNGQTTKEISPDILNSVTSLLNKNLTTTPTVEVTATNPNKSSVTPTIPIDSNLTVTNPPTVEVTGTNPNKNDTVLVNTVTPTTTTTTTTPTKTDTKLTTSDVIKLLGIGTTIAGINAATSGGGGGGVTQYPIVPIPSGWSPATAAKVAPATKLPDINFGDRNLLIGTQWEKFLSPDYGKVPAPVQYSQPSNLSYNDLMSILGSKQGYPAASNLSINDVISGIQNQYGQTPSSTMG
jgi:hypothetical protein